MRLDRSHAQRTTRPLRVVAFIAAFSFAAAACGGARPASFDKDVWKRPVEWCSRSPRGEMASELVEKHLRPGMSAREVRALLGTPNEITPDDIWVYYVDAEPGLLDTCIMLQIYMTRDRLDYARVERDY